MEQFRRSRRAVTLAGQIKDNARHEKDDRTPIGERRFYVLGWSNEQKIDALIEEGKRLLAQRNAVTGKVDSCQGALNAANVRLSALNSLAEYVSWNEIDWQSSVNAISSCQEELIRIRASSRVLEELTQKQKQVRTTIAQEASTMAASQNDLGAARAEQQAHAATLERVDAVLIDEESVELARPHFVALAQLVSTTPSGRALDLSSIDETEAKTVTSLTRHIDTLHEKQRPIASRIIRNMSAFRVAYPHETQEFDDSLASAPEFRRLHDRVRGDDLPRFEREFKEYLNQNTIRDIAGFSAQLSKQEKLIRDRIETINQSMANIEYSPGRYIRLLPDQTTNTEVREFRSELRACTDNLAGSSSDEQYSENKFLQVKRLIDRFKGREGMTDQDRVWTRRVTDVRNWFVFSASERWREDDTEHENYTDTGGKSGGQKEKLAYTILAASLAYQFKLDWGAAKSKSFRFVVIDEAFGRGSEESTRYALQLFTRLGLQLLIVTPLQKIHVIEPHVSAVGYVDNPNGNYSRLQGMTIEEHRERREAAAMARSVSVHD